MWSSAGNAAKAVVRSGLICSINNPLIVPFRTTFILKRRFLPFLHKKGLAPKKLRTRHYVYDLIKDTSVEQQPMVNVILTAYAEGLGNPGDRVSVKPLFAYNNLLLPGLAVYATPENETKYAHLKTENAEQIVRYSSPKAQKMMDSLSRLRLSVIMNKDVPWVLEPWHVRASFRKCGYIVPENCMKLPDKTIKGPDMNVEGKIFYVTVTINNTEKVDVKCLIHHWSTNILDRIPYTMEEFWKLERELLFPIEK